MNTNETSILDSLPVHSDGSEGLAWECLRVDGLVENAITLTAVDLATMSQRPLSQDFYCDEGWVVPDQHWEGVPLLDIMALAGPLPNSNYVTVHAGEYSVGLTMYEVYTHEFLVAMRLNSETLSLEHGGPCRLVTPGKQCFYNVKWIDRIEVSAVEASTTAPGIKSGSRA
jgi:DMSO/TMAO reductase YedYZ molybdopterin-dependent catalytic subunit